MTALAKTLVMALYGEISPGEMALVRGEGLVRAAYSSAWPGLALPFSCCQYLALAVQTVTPDHPCAQTKTDEKLGGNKFDQRARPVTNYPLDCAILP